MVRPLQGGVSASLGGDASVYGRALPGGAAAPHAEVMQKKSPLRERSVVRPLQGGVSASLGGGASLCGRALPGGAAAPHAEVMQKTSPLRERSVVRPLRGGVRARVFEPVRARCQGVLQPSQLW